MRARGTAGWNPGAQGVARILLAGALGAIAVLGASEAGFGLLTATTARAGTVTSGTVGLTIPAAGASNRLSVSASDMYPGMSVYRAFDLRNSGTVAFKSVALTSTATASSALDTDATNGLQITITRCSQAWTESGSSPDFTYSCAGTTTTALASRAAIATSVALSNLGLTGGTTNHLLLTMTLASTSPTSMQGLSSTISYSFTGTVRDASSR